MNEPSDCWGGFHTGGHNPAYERERNNKCNRRDAETQRSEEKTKTVSFFSLRQSRRLCVSVVAFSGVSHRYRLPDHPHRPVRLLM